MKKLVELFWNDLISRFDRYGFIHIQQEGGKAK